MSPPDEAVGERAIRGEAVALARALVATPSVNPALSSEGHGEGAIAELTAGWLDAWGYDVHMDEVAPGRHNVLARLGARGRTLLLNGHLDTVGVEGMTVPPFEARVVDARLLGRGSCDMKGGVAAALAAAAALARTPPVSGTVLIALTADEEHASLGMQAAVEGGLRADAAVVCEPTDLAVMPAHKGFVWLDLTFRGRAAHGSRPDEGVDAIRHGTLYVAALESLASELAETPPHPLLGRGSFHVGTIHGGTAPSVYPADCRVSLERRTLPGEDTASVVEPFRRALEELRHVLPELAGRLDVGLTRPGTEVGSDSPLVVGLLDALERRGLDRRVEGMTAWVDAAFLNEAGIPAVCFGPGSIAQAHSADEWCHTGQIEACAGVLELFARSFLEEG